MVSKSFGILIFFIFVVNGATSQSNFKKERLTEAIHHLNTLNHGCLLIRLHRNSKTVEALEKMGKFQEAEEYRKNQALYNLQIATAFGEQFYSCPIYFFYADDSNYIIDNQYNKVEWVNNKLNVCTTPSIESNYFLIAEFSRVEAFSDVDSKAQFRFPALLFRDAEMKQLHHPFPFYSRTFDDIKIIQRSPYTTVKRWLIKLKEFEKTSH